MTRLLSDRIKDLHLKPDSPYPSEVRDGHDMVLQWRRANRLRVVPDDRLDADIGSDSLVDDGEMTWPL
jgi:hypothetical protein